MAHIAAALLCVLSKAEMKASAGPIGVGDPAFSALAPAEHASIESLQGAKTRRHILRQNSVNFSHESSTGDKERLQANLALYGLVQKEVKGDGNCQARRTHVTV